MNGGRSSDARRLARPVVAGDAGEEGVAGVAGAHPAGALGAVQGKGVGAELLAPERRLEPLAQLPRLLLQRRRARRGPSGARSSAARRLAA